MKRVIHDIQLRGDLNFSVTELAKILNSDWPDELCREASYVYESIKGWQNKNSTEMDKIIIYELSKCIQRCGVERKKIVYIPRTEEDDLLKYTLFRYDIILNLPKASLSNFISELKTFFDFQIDQ